jgi:hypothetical protein
VRRCILRGRSGNGPESWADLTKTSSQSGHFANSLLLDLMRDQFAALASPERSPTLIVCLRVADAPGLNLHDVLKEKGTP